MKPGNRVLYWTTFVLVLLPTALQAAPLGGVNAWIEAHLSSGNAGASAYFFLFLGGVLASLLPCTYPLYPITLNILKARSQPNKKFLHPVVYYAGIVTMYFLFGIIASATGGAFNSILHLPLTNLIISAVVLILALSSMDLLYLPMFSGASTDGQKKSALATFAMGLSAGLLSSACVGPVVVSILIGIAASSNQFSPLLAFTAASKMLFFGIGVGLPFLLIGVFGFTLPKSGKWMKYIQWGLGMLILYFSYSYLEKALLGYGFKEPAISLTAVGMGTLLFSIFHLQPANVMVYQKTKTALFALAAIVGFLLLFKAFLPASDLHSGVAPTTAGNTNEPQTEQKGKLTWYLDKSAAYAAAQQKGKPVFIDFHGDWCTNCKAFQETTQSNPVLNEALQNAILLKVYDGSPTFQQYAADARFPELKVGLPFFIITDKEENLLYKTNDYLKVDEMTLFLNP